MLKLISASFFSFGVVFPDNTSPCLINDCNFSKTTYSLSSSSVTAERIVPIAIAFSSLVNFVYFTPYSQGIHLSLYLTH
ncbi:hypothetical protein B4082_0242 [Bacillus cereus]|uniref:Uncharacterized protein n=1 Tax=Bacillus cereus TaxID=1396 RepID=A0A164ILF4_BACCE|nr:hypothetical protein B4082_0242 [Bacillus cereus]